MEDTAEGTMVALPPTAIATGACGGWRVLLAFAFVAFMTALVWVDRDGYVDDADGFRALGGDDEDAD